MTPMPTSATLLTPSPTAAKAAPGKRLRPGEAASFASGASDAKDPSAPPTASGNKAPASAKARKAGQTPTQSELSGVGEGRFSAVIALLLAGTDNVAQALTAGQTAVVVGKAKSPAQAAAKPGAQTPQAQAAKLAAAHDGKARLAGREALLASAAGQQAAPARAAAAGGSAAPAPKTGGAAGLPAQPGAASKATGEPGVQAANAQSTAKTSAQPHAPGPAATLAPMGPTGEAPSVAAPLAGLGADSVAVLQRASGGRGRRGPAQGRVVAADEARARQGGPTAQKPGQAAARAFRNDLHARVEFAARHAADGDPSADGAAAQPARAVRAGQVAPLAARPAGGAEAQGRAEGIAEQVAAQLRASGVRPGGQVVVRLNPPELGKVRLTLRSSGQELHGELKVTNPETLTQLRMESGSLFRHLADSGVQVRRLEISLDQQGPDQQGQGTTQHGQDAPQDRPGDWAGTPEPAPGGSEEPTLDLQDPLPPPQIGVGSDGSVNLWV